MARIPLNPKVNVYKGPLRNNQPEERYEDLGEGPISPTQITKNGQSLFNFVNGLARIISETEEQELSARAVMEKNSNIGSIFHSKIPELYKLGKRIEGALNAGEYMRENSIRGGNYIQVPLEDILNSDKAFKNITEGYNKPVYSNKNTLQEKTMSDIDISEYIGGGNQRKPATAQTQNNTFFINMDKTQKAMLNEQVKTNKLLGVIYQALKENTEAVNTVPQTVVELIEASKIDPADVGSYSTSASGVSDEADDQQIDDSLIP